MRIPAGETTTLSIDEEERSILALALDSIVTRFNEDPHMKDFALRAHLLLDEIRHELDPIGNPPLDLEK